MIFTQIIVLEVNVETLLQNFFSRSDLCDSRSDKYSEAIFTSAPHWAYVQIIPTSLLNQFVCSLCDFLRELPLRCLRSSKDYFFIFLFFLKWRESEEMAHGENKPSNMRKGWTYAVNEKLDSWPWVSQTERFPLHWTLFKRIWAHHFWHCWIC